MSHPHEDELVLHYYGELLGPEAGELERHLRECPACRESFARLERVLRVIDATPVPEPVDGFEGEVWARLRPGLRVMGPSLAGRSEDRPLRRAERWFGLQTGPRWVFAGGLAALLVIAFLSGALWRETRQRPEATVASRATAPQTPGTAQPAPGTIAPGTQHPLPPGTRPEAPGTTADLRERLLLAVVGEHLERTELVLIELLNARGRETVDISAEQERAQELTLENRLYRQTAQSVGNLAVVSLLDQLDLVLTEVAGGPSAIPAADLDAMQKRIEGQNLLFKVQVVRSALGAQERDAQVRQARMTS